MNEYRRLSGMSGICGVTPLFFSGRSKPAARGFPRVPGLEFLVEDIHTQNRGFGKFSAVFFIFRRIFPPVPSETTSLPTHPWKHRDIRELLVPISIGVGMIGGMIAA